MGAVTDRARPWTAPVSSRPVTATVRLPGSKSMTARALVLSALADGPSELHRPLRARDTTLMAAALRALGVGVDTTDDQSWSVEPGPLRGPARIDVGLAGTIMRFAPPIAALADGTTPFDGDPHARNRPMRPIVDTLRNLYKIWTRPVSLLTRIEGKGKIIRCDDNTITEKSAEYPG